MWYQPIEDYGVIGNMRSAALVGRNGSIDWLCLPRFDSPSVFGAILDADKGGHFRIWPSTEHTRRKQYYWPDTNVLVTRFLHPDGIAEIEDYMPVGAGASPDDQLVRRVHVVRGRLPLRLECRPAFDYARANHKVQVRGNSVRFVGPNLTLGLAS
jgi:GH15 family glucan-1,4-alpha-glucosidase